jgi:hypothetical protein
MRENYLRSTYRQLDWKRKPTHEKREAKANEASLVPTAPWSPVYVAESHTSCAAFDSECDNGDNETEYGEEEGNVQAESQGNSEDEETESQAKNYDDEADSDDSTVNTSLEMESESQISTPTSNVTTPFTSSSSDSHNPFRKRAATPRVNGDDSTSSGGFGQSIWDRPLIVLD